MNLFCNRHIVGAILMLSLLSLRLQGQTIEVGFTSTPLFCGISFSPEIEVSDEKTVISKYHWIFGDGQQSEEKFPVHAYDKNKTFRAKLEIEYVIDGKTFYQSSAEQKVKFRSGKRGLVEKEILVPINQERFVISSSAKTYSDVAFLPQESYEEGSGYVTGERGIWREESDYFYNAARLNYEDPALAGTYDQEQFNWQYAHLDAIPSWKRSLQNTRFNRVGRPIEYVEGNGSPSAIQYDVSGYLPIAQGKNMHADEMAYTDFESEKFFGNWTFGGDSFKNQIQYKVTSGMQNYAVVSTSMESLDKVENADVLGVGLEEPSLGMVRHNEIICKSANPYNADETILVFREPISSGIWIGEILVNTQSLTSGQAIIDHQFAHTGEKSMRVSGRNSFPQQLNLKGGKSYWVSCWASIGKDIRSAADMASVSVQLNFKGADSDYLNTIKLSPSGPVIEGWQQVKGIVTVPDRFSHFEIEFNSGDKTVVWFDDLRLFPEEGNMKTFQYGPLHRLKVLQDENNYSVLYFYDQQGKVQSVRKETEEGMQTLSEDIHYTRVINR